MKVLELFAGTRSIGKAFEKKGHSVTSVELNERFPDCIHTDAYAYLKEHGEEYDVIWASPCCTAYSLAGIRIHRTRDENGRFTVPASEYAVQCDLNNRTMVQWFNDHRDMIWFIENPRGNMQHMRFAECISDLKYTICYCQYGFPTMKPTNIWTTIRDPEWKPMCHPGAAHHPTDKHAFENMMRRYERSMIPEELCDHIVDICERQMQKI